MALILCLESSTTICSVAIGKDGKTIALAEQGGDYSHAENLTVFIERCANEAGISLSQLDAIAVSKGPGSYTGLRIGVSTAKGLCYALNKPLLAISTLEHMAAGALLLHPEIATEGNLLCPMIDARRMEVYCGIYDQELQPVAPVEALIIDENSFADLRNDHRLYFFGDGAAKCKTSIAPSEKAVYLDALLPSATNMIGLAEKALAAGQQVDLAYFEPYYLKDFVAGKKKGDQ